MLDANRIMSLTFMAYGGEMTGDHLGMRYMLRRVGEKPDFKIEATVWPEPLSFEKTDDSQKTVSLFEFTKDGREEAIGWLKKMYEEKKEIWSKAPKLLSKKNNG